MAPRSPTQAFDPTPALEHNRHNFSPFNDPSEHLSEHAGSSRVHFAEHPVPITARHSIATTHVPLLPSVSSASKIPKQAFRITDPPPGIDITAYMENCRNLNEQLRMAHDTERKAWEIERTTLQSRVADLEFQLNKARDQKRRTSNDDSSNNSAQSFKADFRNVVYTSNTTNGSHASRQASDSALFGAPPVWKGPEFTPPVTRVFSNDDDINHLPSISEDEPFPTLSKEVSPTNRDREASTVPIENIDKTLDGINLRSTGPGVTSSFEAKISSPTFGSPIISPSPRPPRNTLMTGGNLTVDIKHLLDPLDEKLRRHAGHTPMAFDGAISTSVTTTNVPSPIPEEHHQPEPEAPVRPPLQPSENSDSYFTTDVVPNDEAAQEEAHIAEAESEHPPQHEATDDPALTGPLMLDPSAKSEANNSFLDQVDAKLLEAANRGRSDTVTTTGSETVPGPPPATGAATNGTKTVEEEQIPKKKYDEEGPVLKMKKSLNFGSAWGKAPAFS